jgi:two-component system NtrC family response regulator
MAKILIVDDDPYSCSLFRALCKTKGHDTTVASTRGEGLKEVTAQPYDLVMLDVHLPDGNGLDALPQFRSAESSPMVIILTALGDPNGAELAIKSGAWDYLHKPIPLQEVALSLTRALEHREIEQSHKRSLFLKREDLVGDSQKMLACLELAARSADSDMNVLICGETGVGKEVVASLIHKNSRRYAKPFVVVDCSSLPESLVESALFGHVKGAFTGAVEDQAGLVKKADGGTLFLDEVGELPSQMQKNLLRVLQERTFRPVGSSREVRSDFRLIAATNRNLDRMVKEEKFRDDLLFRLRTVQIDLPPLRERKEDSYPLAISFMKSLNDRYGHGIKGIGPDFLDAIQNYPWPGNVQIGRASCRERV